MLTLSVVRSVVRSPKEFLMPGRKPAATCAATCACVCARARCAVVGCPGCRHTSHRVVCIDAGAGSGGGGHRAYRLTHPVADPSTTPKTELTRKRELVAEEPQRLLMLLCRGRPDSPSLRGPLQAVQL